jgi:O-antigen/teichoic acid export membrane protein
MPIAAVGHYALVTSLSRQINDVLSPIGQAISPAATELHALGEKGTLERLYHDGSRLMILAMISVVLVASFWADDFYRLWVGEKYLSGHPFPSVALLLRILLIGTVMMYISNIASYILVGSGHVKLVAMLLICGTIVTLIISLILIRPFGLTGLAASGVISAVLVDLIAIPIVLQRVLGLKVKRFILCACTRPIAVGLLFTALIICIRATTQPKNWGELFITGILAGSCALALILLVGVTAEERFRFLIQPLRRLLGMGLSAE